MFGLRTTAAARISTKLGVGSVMCGDGLTSKERSWLSCSAARCGALCWRDDDGGELVVTSGDSGSMTRFVTRVREEIAVLRVCFEADVLHSLLIEVIIVPYGLDRLHML